MKIRFIFNTFNFLMVILLVNITFSCKVAKKQQSTVATDTQKGKIATVLWKVTGNGLAKPSYVLGTMHMLCASDATLSTGLKNVLDSINDIYFELDMDDMAMLMGAFTQMNMKGDTSLKTLLNPQEYLKVKNHFSKAKSMLPFAMLERMQPLLASSTLAEEQMQCDGGASGVELQIMEYNKANKKLPISGLETMQDQLAAFGKISYAEQAKMLLKAIDSAASTQQATAQLVAAYKSQNLDTIENLMVKSEPELEKYMDDLLVNRNKNWIVQLKKIFAQKSIIAAVGAGHLPGKMGVLELLRKEGYTVTPVVN
jgi:uncharacterized protein